MDAWVHGCMVAWMHDWMGKMEGEDGRMGWLHGDDGWSGDSCMVAWMHD